MKLFFYTEKKQPVMMADIPIAEKYHLTISKQNFEKKMK